MARDTFEVFRSEQRTQITTSPRGWAIFVGHDERGYGVTLQKAADETEPHVRVGCRYFTLKEARKHYVSAWRNDGPSYMRRTAVQMLNLIAIGVESAKRRRLIDRNVKFNTTPRKRN